MFGMPRGVLPSGPDGTERLPGPAGAVVPRCRPPQRAAEGQGTRRGSPDRVVDQGGRIVLTSVLPTRPATPDFGPRGGWVGAVEKSGGSSCRSGRMRCGVGDGPAARAAGLACRSNRESGRRRLVSGPTPLHWLAPQHAPAAPSPARPDARARRSIYPDRCHSPSALRLRGNGHRCPAGDGVSTQE
jgi:hypothetical protein